jgi:hypothetical protein
LNETTLLRVAGYIEGQYFCAGAVFELDPPVCTRAADRLEFCLNRGLTQVIAMCRLHGFEYEIVQ